MNRRSTVRWRLSTFYGLLFFLCGVVLILVSYVVVRESLVSEEGTGASRAAQRYGLDEQSVERFLEVPLPEPATGPDGEQVDTVGDVIVGVQEDIRDDALDKLLLGSGVALLVMLVLSVGVGWLAAGRALRPVKELTARARDLSETNLDERIDLDGPDDELKELADTLDALLARLEVAFLSQRRFAADVSHEVRTPLSIIRAEADVTLADPASGDRERRLAHAVLGAASRADGLIESLLALARSDSTMHDRHVVDLVELTGDVVGERVEEADAAHVDIALDLGTAQVQGDRWLLERLVANLVDNAIHHNRPEGWMKVAVGAQNGTTTLAVSNSGPVITTAEAAEIVEPFRRIDHDESEMTPGYGLGMAIVRSVADAHDGSVAIDPRPEGGLDVVVSLPTAYTGPTS